MRGWILWFWGAGRLRGAGTRRGGGMRMGMVDGKIQETEAEVKMLQS